MPLLSGTSIRHIANIWDPPTVAHAYDDEFNSTTLAAAWTQDGTWTNGSIDPYAAFGAGNPRYEIHTDRRRSWITVQPPADAASYSIHKSVTLATNQFVWFRGSFNSRLGTSPTNNDFLIQLILSDDTSLTNAISLALNDCDAGTIQAEFSKTGASISVTIDKYVSQADAQEIEAVGMQKLGTTYHGWAFLANGSAIHLGSTTFTQTIAYCYLRWINAVTTSPGTTLMAVDFIRFVDSATFLP